MAKPVVLIAEELSPATLEALGPDFEVRNCNGADRAELLAALGKGGAGGGTPQLGGGAEGGAEAPAFNLVEGSESNAIQQSIQGQESAVKAFVVSGDVTTAQSADRNIVEGSGF